MTVIIISSCSTPKEEIVRTPPPVEPPVAPAETIKPPPVAEPKYVPQEAPVVRRFRTYMKCGEDTKTVFNSCGIDALPFIRTVFYDLDNDGVDEMIAGSKDGALRLYRNQSTADHPSWSQVEHYFDGINVGVFSSPAAADIDNDGLPEILVGSGGFSSDSGRVTIYRNSGTILKPLWKKVGLPDIKVGNDATPAVADVDNDGKPDLIIGSSTGNLFLFRNRTTDGRIAFEKDPDFFKGVKLGMYVVPAVTVSDNRIIIIAGTDMGKLYIMEKTIPGKSAWSKDALKISLTSFASPTFIRSGSTNKKDMVISEGDGRIYFFRNNKGNYREWEKAPDFFDGRILAGLACTPSVTDVKGRPLMVVGNIDGEIKLFEYNPSSKKLPWKEKQAFFSNIKLPGFSRGVLTDWQGKYLLITGQQNGFVRAFLNKGTMDRPAWTEQKKFFMSLPKIMHAAPSVYDIDGDGKWELIIGDADGNISGFRYEVAKDGMPVWKKIPDIFREAKVDRFAAPSLVRDADKLYLLSGQQDGKINVFVAGADIKGQPVFHKDSYLEGIMVNNHSSPSAVFANGVIELSVGDYNGNLKHFACKNTIEEVSADLRQ